MDRSHTKRNKFSKTNAKTAESSRTKAKRPLDHEAKRWHVDTVQPTGFSTSQEDESSPLQSSLMLSQPLTDSQTSGFEAASAERMASPLLHDLSPLRGTNALDALDGWSLGSNMYFSDTGSGGGFLETQASTAEEESGRASSLLSVCSLQSVKQHSKQTKSKTASPTLSQSSSLLKERVQPSSSQELSEVGSIPVLGAERASPVSLSPLRASDDMLSQDGGDEEEKMVLEFVPDKKPKRYVKCRKKVDTDIKLRLGPHRMKSSLASCPNVGLRVPVLSQGSSRADLFSGSENQILTSTSQSSVDVEDISSAAQLKTKARSSGRLRKKKELEAITSQANRSEKKDNRSTSTLYENIDKLKQNNIMSQEKCSEKEGDKSSLNIYKSCPNIGTSQSTNSETEGEKHIAKTSSTVNKLKSNSQSSADKAFVDGELLKSSEQSHSTNVSQNADDLKPRTQLSVKRARKLVISQKTDQAEGSCVVDSQPYAVAKGLKVGVYSGNSVEKNSHNSKAKTYSTSKKLPVKKTRKRGGAAEKTVPTVVVSSEKPEARLSEKKTRKRGGAAEETVPTVVVGSEKPEARLGVKKTKKRGGAAEETVANNVVGSEKPEARLSEKKTVEKAPAEEDGRTRSPSLFEYESDSMIAPSPLVTHTRKTTRSTDLFRLKDPVQKEKKPFSAEKTMAKTLHQNMDGSENKAAWKSSHLSMSSKSMLTDSGIGATPSSFALAGRPGLAKLKTSTPLDQYRSLVGLDKPRGVKQRKRPRDSGNYSGFIVESNISMPSPVWAVPPVRAQGKGQGQFRDSGTVDKMKTAKTKGVEDVTKRFSKAGPREALTSKSGTKKIKEIDINENLPRSEICLEEELKIGDAKEKTKADARVVDVVDVTTKGLQKKKTGSRGIVSNEARARQLSVEERLLQELEEIDQNYSLIIDD